MKPVISFVRDLTAHPILPPSFIYAWLEGTMKAKLAFLKDIPAWSDLAKWPSGRLFGEAAEYRWKYNLDGTIHAVFLSDEDTLPSEFDQNRFELEVIQDATLLLWGEWVNPKIDPQANPDSSARFFAPEIPGIKTYPLSPDEIKELKDEGDDRRGEEQKKSPCLIVRKYRHEDRGEFIRCIRISLNGGDQNKEVQECLK